MTDRIQQREGTTTNQRGEAVARETNLSFTQVLQARHEEPKRYTEKDVRTATNLADYATKLLGHLEIDHKPGLSRSEIITAEASRTTSTNEAKLLDGLLNLSPSVQEAWQVPGHRAHLMELSESNFYHSSGELMRKQDRDWSDRLLKKATELGNEANRDLQDDRKKQIDYYFNHGAVDKDQLTEVKAETDRIHVALQILPHLDKAATLLLENCHKGSNDLLRLKDVEKSLANGNLAPSERMLLKVVEKYQQDSLPLGRGTADGASSNSMTSLTRKQLAEVLGDWVNAETRADGKGTEALFFRALEGYDGNGLKIEKQDRLNRELDYKNSSQLTEDARNNNFRAIPLAN